MRSEGRIAYGRGVEGRVGIRGEGCLGEGR